MVPVGQESALGLAGTSGSGSPIRIQACQGSAGEDLLPGSLVVVDGIRSCELLD